VIFLEKVSGALEHVDSSSGAIGTAVNRAIEMLVPIVAQAPASDNLRDKWLERLWHAIEDDNIPYIELLAEHWGELCVTLECASRWADLFIEGVRLAWSADLPRGGHFKGTIACLSALYAAGRHEDLLNLLDMAPYKFWHDRQWGVRALVAQGETTAAIGYAEGTRGLNQPDGRISLAIGLAALQWLLRGHGYELTTQDVVDAFSHTMAAARHNGTEADTLRRIQLLVDQHPGAERTIITLLSQRLDGVTKSSAS
jgi:hypothetical protein